MAPIRRYLRITRYSVLEVRIYLDNPADAHRWLLKLGDPALPRVIDAVRPLVLPKLREENERARKGGKKKGVKDVVSRDDFDVSIFLTELSTSHAILAKHKTFDPKGWDDENGTKDAPVEIEDGNPTTMQEDEDGAIDLEKIPQAQSADQDNGSDDSDDVAFQTQPSRPAKPRKRRSEPVQEEDDKKKLGFKTTYDGFRIHGRILCLVVKRKGQTKGKQSEGTGKAMMEDWISSTQVDGAMVDD